MNLAYIDRKNLARLKKHAEDSFPYECIGIFQFYEDAGNFYITDIYECKNVARNKKYEGLLPKKVFRDFNKRLRSGKRKGILYGVYHSHPASGMTILGEQDMYSGTIFKMFEKQIILGAKKTPRDIVVKTAFWHILEEEWKNLKIKMKKV